MQTGHLTNYRYKRNLALIVANGKWALNAQAYWGFSLYPQASGGCQDMRLQKFQYILNYNIIYLQLP